MKLYLFSILMFLFSYQLYSQGTAVAKDSSTQIDTTALRNWIPSGNTGINLSQVSLTNWSQGGENSIIWSVFLNFGLTKEFDKWSLKNKFRFVFGMTKAGDAEFRNNENEIFLETVATYKLSWAIDPYISNSIRTVITDAYDYKTTPSTQIATFFDPAYITQSIGFAYDKVKGLNTRLGIAFQETFANRYTQYTKTPEDSNATFKFETGIESVTSLEVDLATNLHYSSRFRLFGRFDPIDVWDVRFDNTITAKITKYINVNFTALLVHEISQTRRTQIKQGLQIGFAYNLF